MAQLTGNHRYRSNWRGKLILQVEEAVRRTEVVGTIVLGWTETKWRDATILDLFDPQIELEDQC
jgi:hypothetical protein